MYTRVCARGFTVNIVHSVVKVIVKGLARPMNPPGPMLNISLLPPFEAVKYGNPPLGAISTDVPNGLSKTLNLVSQVNGAALTQYSVQFVSSQ